MSLPHNLQLLNHMISFFLSCLSFLKTFLNVLSLNPQHTHTQRHTYIVTLPLPSCLHGVFAQYGSWGGERQGMRGRDVKLSFFLSYSRAHQLLHLYSFKTVKVHLSEPVSHKPHDDVILLYMSINKSQHVY